MTGSTVRDVIEFRVGPERLGEATSEHTTLHPHLNGRPLRELALEAELAGGVCPDIAGAYGGIIEDPNRIMWPSRHFLGEPDCVLFDVEDGRTGVLGCDCGIAACWPLAVVVEVDEDTVTWSHFGGKRSSDGSLALGPFVFDREQYEAALRETEQHRTAAYSHIETWHETNGAAAMPARRPWWRALLGRWRKIGR